MDRWTRATAGAARDADVLRLKEDNKLPKETLGRINEQIRDRRFWRVFYEAGDFRVGVWRRSE